MIRESVLMMYPDNNRLQAQLHNASLSCNTARYTTVQSTYLMDSRRHTCTHLLALNTANLAGTMSLCICCSYPTSQKASIGDINNCNAYQGMKLGPIRGCIDLAWAFSLDSSLVPMSRFWYVPWGHTRIVLAKAPVPSRLLAKSQCVCEMSN